MNDLRALCRSAISIAAHANRRSVLEIQSASTPASRSAKNDAKKRVLTHCINCASTDADAASHKQRKMSFNVGLSLSDIGVVDLPQQ